MGTCCGAHLTTKVRNNAKNAQNGAVTVTVIENPEVKILNAPELTASGKDPNISVLKIGKCDYCEAPAEFACSYYPK